MRNIYLFLCFLGSLSAFAQGENDNWYFGEYAALNFATNPPTAVSGCQMNQIEGVASVSNPAGQLLFYSDGITVWGANNVAMPNGTGLLGSISSSQSALIVPHPGNINIYYLFTTSDMNGPRYSVIDMTLNGGFGDIISGQKNLNLQNAGSPINIRSEAITVTENSAGNGYWVLHASAYTFYAFPVTTSGFVNTPVTTPLTFTNTFAGIATIRVSPDSNKVALARLGYGSQLRVYDFDNSTGIADTSMEFGLDGANIYSTEFSANSNVLYGNQSSMNTICAINLQTYQVKFMYSNTHIGTLQRSKYNDIYFPQGHFNNGINGSPFLSRIINADDFINSSLQLNAVPLVYGLSQTGLPQRVPARPKALCPYSITLSTPEVNTSFLYQYDSSITATGNYEVNTGQNITFKAGDFILLQPNTLIKPGSIFLATIEECPATQKQAERKGTGYEKTNECYIINLDETPVVKLYPNPARDNVSLTIDKLSIQKVTVTAIDGTTVLEKTPEMYESSYTFNVSMLPAGIYIVNTTVSGGKTTSQKLIIE